jgi:hypothetical protein
VGLLTIPSAPRWVAAASSRGCHRDLVIGISHRRARRFVHASCVDRCLQGCRIFGGCCGFAIRPRCLSSPLARGRLVSELCLLRALYRLLAESAPSWGGRFR